MNIQSIVIIAVGILVGSAILPTAFDNWFGANTTTWDAATASLWPLIPLGVVVALVILYMGRRGTGGA